MSDISVVAKAIGVSEADLQTALDGGQTVAAVATAHNVAVQTVIDALVADGQSELAADVTAGRLAQAQADAQKAQVTQRTTDQVNGTMLGGPMGAPRGFGHWSRPTPAPARHRSGGTSAPRSVRATRSVQRPVGERDRARGMPDWNRFQDTWPQASTMGLQQVPASNPHVTLTGYLGTARPCTC